MYRHDAPPGFLPSIQHRGDLQISGVRPGRAVIIDGLIPVENGVAMVLGPTDHIEAKALAMNEEQAWAAYVGLRDTMRAWGRLGPEEGDQ